MPKVPPEFRGRDILEPAERLAVKKEKEEKKKEKEREKMRKRFLRRFFAELRKLRKEEEKVKWEEARRIEWERKAREREEERKRRLLEKPSVYTAGEYIAFKIWPETREKEEEKKRRKYRRAFKKALAQTYKLPAGLLGKAWRRISPSRVAGRIYFPLPRRLASLVMFIVFFAAGAGVLLFFEEAVKFAVIQYVGTTAEKLPEWTKHFAVSLQLGLIESIISPCLAVGYFNLYLALLELSVLPLAIIYSVTESRFEYAIGYRKTKKGYVKDPFKATVYFTVMVVVGRYIAKYWLLPYIQFMAALVGALELIVAGILAIMALPVLVILLAMAYLTKYLIPPQVADPLKEMLEYLEKRSHITLLISFVAVISMGVGGLSALLFALAGSRFFESARINTILPILLVTVVRYMFPHIYIIGLVSFTVIVATVSIISKDYTPMSLLPGLLAIYFFPLPKADPTDVADQMWDMLVERGYGGAVLATPFIDQVKNLLSLLP